jgi:hypothetical protein
MKNVIVEKFRPEIENDLYHIRMYQMLGNHSICRRLASHDPLVKFSNSVEVETIEPHPVVKIWQKEFNIDYGKFDYVVVDGEPILLDVNKTTGASPNRKSAKNKDDIYLAEGIFHYFNDI